MAPSNADLVLQNRRISQSETSNLNICDVVNTMAAALCAGSATKMPLLQYFRLLLDYRYYLGRISQRTNHGMRSDAN